MLLGEYYCGASLYKVFGAKVLPAHVGLTGIAKPYRDQASPMHVMSTERGFLSDKNQYGTPHEMRDVRCTDLPLNGLKWVDLYRVCASSTIKYSVGPTFFGMTETNSNNPAGIGTKRG